MDKPDCYELEAAIESWREELLAQTQLTADDRRELETHLRDAIGELRGRGMDDEESFVLARHRTGSPPQIASEFVKADPVRVWRQRALWMAVALLAMSFWSAISQILIGLAWLLIPRLTFSSGSQLQLIFQTVNLTLYLVPVAGLAVILSNGRIAKNASWLQVIFSSRIRFRLIAGAAVFSLLLFQLAMTFRSMSAASIAAVMHGSANIGIITSFAMHFFGAIRLAALVALIAWLMPAQNRRTPEPA